MAEIHATPQYLPNGSQSSGKPRVIVLVACDGVEPLDLFGPASVFAKANLVVAGAYDVVIASPAGGMIALSGGLVFGQTVALDALSASLDTVLVVGAEADALRAALAGPIPRWLAQCCKPRRMGSVCTGAFLLAAAGLLDGRRATTHWRGAEALQALHPNVTVDPDPIFIHDGVYTSAGITSGIDLALALVAEDLGQPAANAVARELVVYARRSGGQAQFSTALGAQSSQGQRVAATVQWLLANLQATLNVTTLAQKAGMSERTFARVFAAETGLTPADFVARARTDHAINLIETSDLALTLIAQQAGFGSLDSLQRAFRKRGLAPPSDYRRHFGAVHPTQPTPDWPEDQHAPGDAPP